MLFLKIFWACLRRWVHCISRIFFLDFKHQECSLTTCMNGIFFLKIYCSCGKIFGKWKIKTREKK